MEAATHSTPPAAPSTNGGTPGRGSRSYDAIVVGGGHNGLTTTAYLARAGLRVLCLERRDILGGACVTEELWPGARVSRCSYVVSMLQPKIVSDLELERFGYRAIPLDPAYVSLTEEGPIFFFNEVENTAKSIARYSSKDAEAYPKFEELMDRAARFVKPMMLREAPAVGSKSPGDLAALLREAGRMAGFSKREVHELVRVFTMSVGDLLDDYFELDGLKGSTASSGVVGVWAGPRTPGTAYNLLHHALGECGGIEGAWGQVIGGMGAISEAIAASARERGRRDPHRGRGRLDRRPQRLRGGRHARRWHRAAGPDRRVRRPPQDDRARAHRGRELPGRDRGGHGAATGPAGPRSRSTCCSPSRPSTRASPTQSSS